MFRDLAESRLVVPAGMLIALPGVDAKTPGVGLVFERGLTKCEIAFATVDTELNEDRRSQQRDKVVGEMKMRRPGAYAVNPRFEVARGQISVDNFRSHARRAG